MIKLTFEKYSFSSLTSESETASELNCLPDQLIDAMRDMGPRIDAFEADYNADVAAGMPELLADMVDPNTGNKRTRIIIPTPRLPWAESVAMTSATAYALSPAFGRQFDQLIANGWGEFTHTTVPGLSMGYTHHKTWKPYTGGLIAAIELQTDGTINDPVYLTHEAGHYVAFMTRGDYKLNRRPPISMVRNEVQAFFFQFAGYDERLGLVRRSDIAEALDQHRRAEMLAALTASKIFIGRLDNYRAGVHPLDSEQGMKDKNGAGLAHSAPHGYGALLGAALYSRYRTMSLADKDRLLDVLYPRFESFPENDGQPPLAAVLAAVGVETAPQLVSFFHEGADLALSPSTHSATPGLLVLPKRAQSALQLSV